MKLTLFCDPGHGWLRVRKSLVAKSGVTITPYSYQDETYAYLEEDLDAHTFLRWLKAQGREYTIEQVTCNGDSPIRSYRDFSQQGSKAA